MKHELDLRANALDSLNEGLRKYISGRGGDVSAYKFAVLHFAHFIELLMKDAVARLHPLLLYDRPATRPIEKSNTIGLWSAIHILQNAGHSIDKDLYSDLEWLKKLRNSIEHFSFDMDVREVRSSLGRLLRAADEFVETTHLAPLAPGIAKDCAAVFEELLDEYRDRLANARSDARENAGDSGPSFCAHCGEQDVTYLAHDELVCAFCEQREPLRECAICGEIYRESEVSIWNDEHDTTDYACTYCEDRIFGEA